MKKEWVVLLRQKNLFCHLCGLLITSQKHLTADHFPIPRSKGGTETRPAHYWCDQAHGDKNVIKATDLIVLINKWKQHKIKYPSQTTESIKALKAREK